MTQASESSVAYFRLLHSALLKITDSLSLAEQFQDIFILEERVDTALLAVYDAIKVYLDRILTVMRRRSKPDSCSFGPFRMPHESEADRQC